jgi:McrBC 5-methylcytosine restriction system component
MQCIDVVEGEEFSLTRVQADRLRDAVERLRVKLNPSFSVLSERAGRFRLTNVVGTIDLGGGTLVQVSPKVGAENDWVSAVVALLTGKEGIDVAGERRAGFSANHNRLLDAVADTYRRRLERAFRQEGPIVLMERRSTELPCLHGKLDASRWVRTALWRPHIFPVVRTEFAQDNPFTRGLLMVADALATVCTDQRTRVGLRALSRDLSVGLPRSAPPPSGIASRNLPEQWSAYKPAWSLATAILSRTSLFGPTGSHSGIGLAIEAWPLLETLLERTLRAIERAGRSKGRVLSYQVQGEVPLLTPRGPAPQSKFLPAPDGRLFEGERLLATFEAKYSSHNGAVPKREHIYQALATAAACGAPTSVLVYPESFEPQVWDVSGLSGYPGVLVAIGLGLFKRLNSSEVDARAAKLLDYIDKLANPTSASAMAVAA